MRRGSLSKWMTVLDWDRLRKLGDFDQGYRHIMDPNRRLAGLPAILDHIQTGPVDHGLVLVEHGDPEPVL